MKSKPFFISSLSIIFLPVLFLVLSVNSCQLTLISNNFSSSSVSLNSSSSLANITILSKVPTYTVTYNCNNAISGVVPVDTGNYTNGQKFKVLSNTGNLALPSFTFSGWNTYADGTGTSLAPGQNFNILPLNMTLFAIWMSSADLITSFSFLTVNNSGLSQNVTGIIAGSNITLILPPGASLRPPGCSF